MKKSDVNIKKGSLHYAFIAGLCAALASLCGKLTSDEEIRKLFSESFLEPFMLVRCK